MVKKEITCLFPGCGWRNTVQEEKAVGAALGHTTTHYRDAALTTCKNSTPDHECRLGTIECLRKMVVRHIEGAQAVATTASNAQPQASSATGGAPTDAQPQASSATGVSQQRAPTDDILQASATHGAQQQAPSSAADTGDQNRRAHTDAQSKARSATDGPMRAPQAQARRATHQPAVTSANAAGGRVQRGSAIVKQRRNGLHCQPETALRG